MQLDYLYVCKIAPRKYERAPVLLMWTNGCKERLLAVHSVAWRNRSQTHARVNKITIPVDKKAKMAADAALHIEALAQMDNELGQHMRARVGYARIFIKDIVDAALRDGNKATVSAELILYNYEEGKGKRFSKGTITLQNIDLGQYASGAKFRDAHAFSMLPSNEQFISSTFRNLIGRSILPYTEQAAAAGLAIAPVDPALQRVHAPFYNTTAGLTYGAFYWITPNESSPAASQKLQPFYDSLIEIVLARVNRTASWFRSVVEGQFARNADRPDDYDDRFTEAARLVGEAVCVPSTSLPYVGDSVNINQRGDKLPYVSENVHATESWDCAICRNGGDCEDLACLIHRCYRGLRTGTFEKSSLAALAQSILRLYIGGGSLGSVLSAALGNDANDAEAAKKPYIIGTRRDNDVKVGAHMWYELVPAYKFVALLKRTTNNVPDNLELLTPAWRIHLPHMICEGTGRLDPLQRPRISYDCNSTREQRLEEIAAQERRRDSLRHLLEKTRVTKLMQIVRQQQQLTRLPNARVNHFYRHSTGFVTADLLDRGYSVMEFMWAQVGDRVPTSASADQLFLDDPLSAASLHHVAVRTGEDLVADTDFLDNAAAQFESCTASKQAAKQQQQQQLVYSAPLEHEQFKRTLERATLYSEFTGAAIAPRIEKVVASSKPTDSLLREICQQPTPDGVIKYGVNMYDKLQDRPLMPHVALYPATCIDQVEARCAATLFSNLRPTAMPGRNELADLIMQAETQSLKEIGLDPEPDRGSAQQQFHRLKEWIISNKLQKVAAWPTAEEAERDKLSLVTLFFPIDDLRSSKVADAIVEDYQPHLQSGFIVSVRVSTENSLPGRTDVRLQFYCDAHKIK